MDLFAATATAAVRRCCYRCCRKRKNSSLCRPLAIAGVCRSLEHLVSGDTKTEATMPLYAGNRHSRVEQTSLSFHARRSPLKYFVISPSVGEKERRAAVRGPQSFRPRIKEASLLVSSTSEKLRSNPARDAREKDG